MLRLAQVRFQEAGLGGELYPESPEQLRQQLAYLPADRPCTVHLPRNINLLRPEGLARVMAFAARAAGNVHGMVVHDHVESADGPDREGGDLTRLQTLEARTDLADRLNEEFDRELLELAMEAVKQRVEPQTWEAFRLTTIEGLSGAEAGSRLGQLVGTAFVAKHRVQKLLVEEIRRLESPDQADASAG